jgi:prolyl-tRNA editing enzyme YbaK/EbsC (Cys-tRNA(Pro) deacylase)
MSATTASVPGWLLRYLHGYGVRYRVRYHRRVEPAKVTAATEHVPALWYAKVVIMTDGIAPTVLVMPSYAQVDLTRARIVTHRPELRLATRGEIERFFPDIPIGAVPPLHCWPYAEIWMDPLLEHDGPILFPAGTHRASVELDFRDWLRITQPRVGRFVEPSFIGA